MFKHIKLAAAVLLLSVGFVACSDDPAPTPTPTPVRGEAGMYIINQGNAYGKLASSIDFISFAEGGTNVSGMFQTANQQALGMGAQKGVVYGSKVYIPMFDENKLWVADATTMKIVGSVQTNAPEAVCGSDGYVFVTNNDGYVTRIDTLELHADQPLEVGPNPSGITAFGGKVYAAISDGYNYSAGYVNGFKVAVIDAKTNTKQKDIAVGMNPTQITSDNLGNVFVVCMGNYADVLPKVWRITPDDQAKAFCDGSLIACDNQQRTSRNEANVDLLYVINSVTDWNTYVTTVTGAVYTTTTNEAEALPTSFLNAEHMPAAPTAIDINPTNGHIFVCSDLSSSDYSSPGYVMEYTINGGFVKQHQAGVHPYGVMFK